MSPNLSFVRTYLPIDSICLQGCLSLNKSHYVEVNSSKDSQFRFYSFKTSFLRLNGIMYLKEHDINIHINNYLHTVCV